MYIKYDLLEDKIDHKDYFKKACPNPLKKKVNKLLRINGKYLNKDNWPRGLYLVAEKYNLFGKYAPLGRDRSYKLFFENWYNDPIGFQNKILELVGAESVDNHICQITMTDANGSCIEYSEPSMTVEEFARLNPKGNFLLITKCKIKNNCKQCIPVFDGRFLNNCNAHYWAVVGCLKLKNQE